MLNIKKARRVIKAALIKVAMPLIYKAENPTDYEIVLRVEDSMGNGCYRGIWWASSEDWDRFNKLDTSNPSWQEDEGRDDHEKNMSDEDISPYLFGFKDPGQYNRWFTEEQKELLSRNDFSLVERKAAEIRATDKQAAFIPYEDIDA